MDYRWSEAQQGQATQMDYLLPKFGIVVKTKDLVKTWLKFPGQTYCDTVHQTSPLPGFAWQSHESQEVRRHSVLQEVSGSKTGVPQCIVVAPCASRIDRLV